MAQTSQEFIQNAFSPMIAVMNSTLVDAIVQKNNLNFVELLQPFCRLKSEGYVRDSSGSQCTVRNLKLIVSNVNTRPPQPILARKFLNESVNSICSGTINLQLGNYQIDIPNATPWFETWRETFFHVQFPSDHEFTKHFVACLLVASTSEQNPLETISHMAQQLSQMQNVTPPKLPKWFNANVLRCYVLLHDSLEGNIDRAEKYYESMKHTYGAGNCFFLSINSRNLNDADKSVLPDPWSKFLIRRPDYNESSSEKDSLPRTPADTSAVSSMPTNLGDMNTLGGTVGMQATEGGAVTVQVHPLSPSEEATSIDAPDSLQSESMVTSIEGEGGIINPNVWEPTSPNGGIGIVHGINLTTQDMENIRNFVQDFALKALLPYFERQIYQLQDVISNKKGVSRSLLSATKRWFGTNKPGTNAPDNSIVYIGDCAELQLRRLGDIWFMLGQWNAAFQAYHTAKREYSADGAWLCYAGALEMAALSAFMANEPSRKTFDYMEESIMTYMNSCRMPQYAVRASLLSVQCLSNRGLYGEAAKQLIRMTSEDCDLRSALLLEQAALCFLAGPPRRALPRKYAFHMVLAGHRYSKSGQRKHSLRCYRQAYQVYRGGGWRLATDHIEFAVGRLAGQVKSWEAATQALSSLLAPRSLQPPPQQAAFLREYLHVHQQWIVHESDQQANLPILPVPILDSNMTAVLCGGETPAISPGRLAASGTSLMSTPQSSDKPWGSLEEMLLYKARGAPPMIFKPSLSLFCSTTDNSTNPVAPQGEPIHVLVHLQNPLQIDVTITDVQLLWQFKSRKNNSAAEGAANETVFSNESCVTSAREYDKSIVVTQKVPIVVMYSDKVTSVSLSLTPLHPGELALVGVAYKLCNPIPVGEDAMSATGMSVLGKQVFKIRGPKLKGIKESSTESQYGIDKRLDIVVVPPAPCLQVTFTEVSPQLLCGELQRVNVEFRNAGRVALKCLYMATSHPQHISLSVENDIPFTALLESRYLKPPLIQDERQQVMDREKRIRNRHCVKVLDTLGAGQVHNVVLWLQAPLQTGSHVLNALFYYENSQANSLPKHRLLRHTWNIQTLDSVQVSATPKQSLRPDKNKTKYEEALNIPIQVKNANQIHHGVLTAVTIQQVSLLSQSWTLDGFVPIHRDIKTLRSQETLHMIMHARRSFNQRKDDEIVSSDISLDRNSNMISIREKPYSNFVTDFASIFDGNEMSNEMCNLIENTALDNQSTNSTLVIRWKADITESGGLQRVAIGQHHLNLNKLNVKMSSIISTDAQRGNEAAPIKLFGSEAPAGILTSSSKMSLSEEDDKLVTFSLEHQLEVTHNFQRHRICLVPVKVHLVNCSTKSVIAIISTTDISSPKSNANNKSNGVAWVGAGGNSLGGIQVPLAALRSTNVPLQVACTFPGTYSLGSILRVSCKIKYEEELSDSIVQGHSACSTLIVIQRD